MRNTHRKPLVILLFVQCILNFSCSVDPTELNHTVNVVLLAGQSNMAGHGDYNTLGNSEKQQIQTTSKRSSISLSGRRPVPLSFTFSKYQKQKRGFAETFGPELFMGLALAEKHPNQEYLFIKTAQGGTSLYGAWNPQWTQEQAKLMEKGERKQALKLFSLHIEHIKANLDRLQKQGRNYRIIGMAWMQGENDASREISSRSYEKNLTQLISAYRQTLNLEAMPFVIGQINSAYGNFPQGPDMVREAMAAVADADTKVAIIKTSQERNWLDYPKHSDNVHYNTEGQKRLGLAFAEKLNVLQKHRP